MIRKGFLNRVYNICIECERDADEMVGECTKEDLEEFIKECVDAEMVGLTVEEREYADEIIIDYVYDDADDDEED